METRNTDPTEIARGLDATAASYLLSMLGGRIIPLPPSLEDVLYLQELSRHKGLTTVYRSISGSRYLELTPLGRAVAAALAATPTE